MSRFATPVTLFLLLAAAGAAGATGPIAVDAAGPADLVAAAAGEPAWITWSVPATPGRGRSCCYRQGRRGCSLDGADGWATDDEPAARADGTLRVYVELDDGRPRAVRAFSADCPVDAGGVRLLDGGALDAGASVAWLTRIVVADPRGAGEEALGAIAGHAGPEALAALLGWTEASDPELRETSAFWLGASRGEDGLDRLVEMIDDDPSSDVREHAVFALSLVDSGAAVDALVRTARRHPDGEIRGTALFWLGQKAGSRIEETLRRAVDDDPLAEVREQAVFALSQLPPDRGVPLLIDLAREHGDPRVRRQALFWLGQSGDPRAIDVFESLLR